MTAAEEMAELRSMVVELRRELERLRRGTPSSSYVIGGGSTGRAELRFAIGGGEERPYIAVDRTRPREPGAAVLLVSHGSAEVELDLSVRLMIEPLASADGGAGLVWLSTYTPVSELSSALFVRGQLWRLAGWSRAGREWSVTDAIRPGEIPPVGLYHYRVTEVP